MKRHHISNFIHKKLTVNGSNPHPAPTQQHKLKIHDNLLEVGMPKYEMMRSEIRYLPNIIHADEHIGGVVYGHHQNGFALLVATDRRVIFLDKKPLFVQEDEISYDVVSGVSYGHVGISSTVTLHTRIQDYTMKTHDDDCAQRFVEYIEGRCLEYSANVNQPEMRQAHGL